MRAVRSLVTAVVLAGGVALAAPEGPAREAAGTGSTPGAAPEMRKEPREMPTAGVGWTGDRDEMAGEMMGAEEALVGRLAADSKLAEDLGLSEDQVKKLKDGMLMLKKEQIDLKAELEKSGLEQARLLTEKKVDEAAVMKIVDGMGAIRTQLAKSRVKQLLLVKGTLSPEQMSKARDLMREHLRRRAAERSDEGGDRRPGAALKRWGAEGRGAGGATTPTAEPPAR